MTQFATLRLIASDGSDVRVLPGLPAGSMAHFEPAPGQVARAVTDRAVEEARCVLGGRGAMWRQQGERQETVALEPGVCPTIPRGTHFQFCASDDEPVSALAVTMPPWPGEGEAVRVAGPWRPSQSDGGE